jgi:uncharacterized repeat protein (TIGR01451 family)
VRCNVKTTTTIGTVIRNYSSILPIINDTVPADNIDSLIHAVRGSYDPNDKLIDPTDAVIIDSAQAGKQFYEYTIRFQNTGTDTAFQIRILDTLSSKLDINTMEVVAASHSFVINYKHSKIFEFYFPNVLLPDSNRNEPGSHGFIKFRIKPVTSVVLNDSIKNSASIYFDYNLPVRTNTTVSVFRNAVITGVGNVNNDSKSLKVFPNPAINNIFYELTKTTPGDHSLLIYDIHGRLLYQSTIYSPGQTLKGNLSIDFLNSGLYILELKGKKSVARKKFVKI